MHYDNVHFREINETSPHEVTQTNSSSGATRKVPIAHKYSHLVHALEEKYRRYFDPNVVPQRSKKTHSYDGFDTIYRIPDFYHWASLTRDYPTTLEFEDNMLKWLTPPGWEYQRLEESPWLPYWQVKATYAP